MLHASSTPCHAAQFGKRPTLQRGPRAVPSELMEPTGELPRIQMRISGTLYLPLQSLETKSGRPYPVPLHHSACLSPNSKYLG